MGRIPEETIEKIIQSNNIVDVISEFVPLKKTGHNYMGVCPFHNDKGPSLSVSMEKGVYHCFGCGASGNVITFIMKIRNLEYIDAVRYLADRAGITIYDEESVSNENSKEIKLKEKLYKINIDAARFFYSNLFRNKEPYNYLVNRKIDESIIKRFGLGYSLNEWDSLYSYLKKIGYEDELIFISGLVLKSKNNTYYDRFRNRIMFPVFDNKGRIIGFGGRVLDNSKPKYLNSPETPVFHKGTNLYGLNFAVKSGLPGYLIMVEGYMDLISLHQFGITNSVASLGTALTNDQAKLIKRYCKDVFICYDADAAGKAATLRGIEILEENALNVKIVSIPKGKDPDEFLKTFGRVEFDKLIQNSTGSIEYRILKAKDGKNLKDIHEKSQFVKEAATILSKLKNEIDIQIYVSHIYDQTGIDSQAILDEIKKIKRTTNNDKLNYKDNSRNPFEIEPGYKKAERNILRYLVSDIRLYDFIKNKITPNEFITESYKIASDEIFKSLEKGEIPSAQSILAKFENEEDIKDVANIFQNIQVNDNSYRFLDDYIKTIKKYNIELILNDLNIKIKRCEENNQIEESTALTQKLIGLTKQLKML
ncbi:MAG TPA: DNA primase [Clostridiaceae bacterium]|jgi:DNA primase|nr:DNA primase [Clostridiaceae bacterium]